MSDLIESAAVQKVSVEDAECPHRLGPALIGARHKLRRAHSEAAVPADSNWLRARRVSWRTPDRDGSGLASACLGWACAPLLLGTQTASIELTDAVSVRFILTSSIIEMDCR